MNIFKKKAAPTIKHFAVGSKNLETREIWLEKTLKEVPAGWRILDAGAGELQYKKFCTHLDYVSQDFGGYDGQGDEVGLQTQTWDNSKLDIVSDIINIPVEDKSFDAIMCIEVFEHIVEPAKAVKEFARILKPGGRAIITAPFCSITHFAPYHYANGYSKYWYKEVLEREGFEVLEITPNGNYFEYVAQETRRLFDIAKRYANYDMKGDDIEAMNHMLGLLQHLTDNDTDSNTLLNFGYHVVAVKK